MIFAMDLPTEIHVEIIDNIKPEYLLVARSVCTTWDAEIAKKYPPMYKKSQYKNACLTGNLYQLLMSRRVAVYVDLLKWAFKGGCVSLIKWLYTNAMMFNGRLITANRSYNATDIVAGRVVFDRQHRIIRSGYFDAPYRLGSPFRYGVFLKKACSGKSLDAISYAIGLDCDDYNAGLMGACKSGSIKIMELMIHHGANPIVVGLKYACMSGNLNAVFYMMDNRASDYDNGLNGAWDKGHLEIVEFMVSKGATMPNLYWACIRDMRYVDLVLKYGATDYNEGLSAACGIRNKEMAARMESLGADKRKCTACRNGKKVHITDLDDTDFNTEPDDTELDDNDDQVIIV